MSGPASVLSRVANGPYTTYSVGIDTRDRGDERVPHAPEVAHGSTPSQLSSALSELEKQLELVTKVDMLIADNAQLRDANRSLQRSLESQQRESNSLREENSFLVSRVRELEGQVADSRAEAAGLKESLRTTQAHLEEKTHAASHLNTELSKLQLELAERSQDVQAAQMQLENLSEEARAAPAAKAGPGVSTYLYDAGTGNVTSALAPYLPPSSVRYAFHGIDSFACLSFLPTASDQCTYNSTSSIRDKIR